MQRAWEKVKANKGAAAGWTGARWEEFEADLGKQSAVTRSGVRPAGREGWL